ncbi:MAG: glycerol-3-phosphate 1-O-acyltransferase PlsY [Candidatus Heimdallarchaeaceae archaeon]
MSYEIVYEILLLLLGYLCGSIPVAYLIGKLFHGIDIREHGSGNMGTANVLRTLGKKAGLTTLVLDMLKGTIAVLCARFYLWFGNYSYFGTDSTSGFPLTLDEGFFLALVAFMTIIGHSLPIWLKFRGGKSAAVGAGAILGINPLAWGVIMIIWFVLLKTTKLMSLSNLTVSLISIPFYWYFGGSGNGFFGNQSLWALLVSVVMVVFIYWRHRANIKRLLTGAERKMGQKVDIEKENEAKTEAS